MENEMKTSMVCLSRRDLPDGMAVTVFENTDRDTFHVGLLDVDSGNYVAGSVRIFPASVLNRRAAVNAYADSLIDEVA
jgi:hypothetical protein